MPQLVVGSEKAIIWVSEEDFEDALKYNWCLNRGGYAWASIGGKRIFLHRWVADRAGLVMDALIDHRDRDRSNNRRDNLRYADATLNNHNKGLSRNNGSGYKGVRVHRPGFTAQCTVQGKQRYIGYFDDPVSAAVAYDKVVLEIYGEAACTNLRLGLITEKDYITATAPKQFHKRGSTGFVGVSMKKEKGHKRTKPYVAIAPRGWEGKKVISYHETAREAALAYDLFVNQNRLNKSTNTSLGLL